MVKFHIDPFSHFHKPFLLSIPHQEIEDIALGLVMK